MRKLRISVELSLPPDTVTSTIIVYGGKGMGKTVFGSVLAEELDANSLRWAWLDPLGVSHGIRHSASGKGPGVECLILGGVHGDIPIDPSSGAAVADVVIDETCNVLIDFSRTASGKMWGVGEKIRFCAAYARRLFERQGELIKGRKRASLMQILDEGARYIPQNIPHGSPALSECVAAWQQFAEEGRNVGLGLCVLTQRSARLNKDIAELADAMFAFRTIGPNSLAAVLDWLGEHVEKTRIRELGELTRKLPRGSALVVSPGWLEVEAVVPIRMRRTFDSSATPKAGERPRIAKGSGAKPDIKKIQARMTAQIEQVKANDPKELFKKITELQREKAGLEKELAKKPSVVAAPAPSKPTKGVVLDADEIVVDRRHLKETIEASEEFESDVIAFEKLLGGLKQALDRTRVLANTTVKAARRARDTGPAALSKRLAKAPLAPTTPRSPSPVVASKPTGANGSLAKPYQSLKGAISSAMWPAGERAIMIAVAQNSNGASRELISLVTGYKTSTRNAYLQRLDGKGFVEAGARGTIVATQAGLEALGSEYEPLPTGRALLDYWLSKLSEGEQKVLRVVAAEYPSSVERDTIGELTGYKQSTRNAYLQRLGTRRLVTGRGEIRLSEELSG